jgi:transcriptional/translational regulatory protein YebC/TACO1
MEGFASGGVPVLLEVETDNKNRTLSEIKNIFKKFGGNFGENGSVSFLFERVGEIEVMEELDEERQLKLIDSGAVDFEDKIIVVKPEDVDLIRKRVEEMALKVIRAEITMRAKMPKRLKNEEGEKLESLLESLEESEDVLRVFKGAI